jgi:hypothetical protein
MICVAPPGQSFHPFIWDLLNFLLLSPAYPLPSSLFGLNIGYKHAVSN